MNRASLVTLASLAVLLTTSPASAQSLAELARRCEALRPRLDELQDARTEVQVVRRGTHVELAIFEAGTGRWADYLVERLEVGPRCALYSAGRHGWRGQWHEAVFVRGPTRRDPMPLLRRDGLRVGRRGTPAHAAAELVLAFADLRDAPYPRPTGVAGLTVTGPLLAPQPEHRGQPRGIDAPTYWPGVGHQAEDTPGTQVGRAVTTVGAPTRVATFDRYAVYVTRSGARRGGGLVAVHDTARDHHRWVLVSPINEMLEGNVSVIGGSGVAIVRASRPVLIDLARGTAHLLSAPGRVEPGIEDGALIAADHRLEVAELLRVARAS